ncbi:OmpA family protein [Biformimicrobium ophioploci]|uniref:OmpA family protein n=1 Tax=Biformimicrobium ophioploci TaxID=3036711 RepID=A0ABQ6LVR2_9GAMM|nr:OmpA family protein [Microbulbifer sp. NKW57]GMG86189.1 OmpA family protein [Microbulbifer sp. NKW57]
MRKLKGFSALLLSASVAVAVQAQETHQAEITGMVGWDFIDSDRDLENGETASLGFGYVLNEDWTVEAFAQWLDSEHDDTGFDVDGRQYRLDALYHFAPSGDQGQWRTFVLFGAGDQKFEFGSASRDHDETFANVGLGFKYRLSSCWQLRADARTLYSLDEEDMDFGLNFGISYLLGARAPAPVPVMPAPVPAPAPEPVVEQDSDGDGVPDRDDKCLNTPYGSKVNAEGCVLVRARDIRFDLSLRFAHDSDVIESHDPADVQQLVEYMERYGEARIVVEGHTDSSGSAAYNKRLSERRAAAMVRLLTGQYGIDPARLSSVGYGEERPIADNSTEQGRAANRRVVGKVAVTVEEPVTE